jgi:hypothetical protein
MSQLPPTKAGHLREAETHCLDSLSKISMNELESAPLNLRWDGNRKLEKSADRSKKLSDLACRFRPIVMTAN